MDLRRIHHAQEMAVDSSRLPFEVGQEAESKCFEDGFRSAWFRCKIKNISLRKGIIGYSLEFFDFPDEKVRWTKLYQKPKGDSKVPGETKLELMVRPSFPPCFRESERPDLYPASDIVAIVEDDWEVGDLVDWWSDGCFWSGRVTQLLGNDKVQVELPEPPIGEGNSYEALCKDLRPSLNWSPGTGWTVPISRENSSSQYCARLIQPLKQDEETEGDAFVENTTEGNEVPINLKLDDVEEEEYSSDASSSHGKRKDECFTPRLSSRAGRYGSSSSQEKIQSRYTASRRHSDTVDSAVMELEELANKIRWLKGLLQCGFRWSNAMKPSWKILENCGPHTQR